MDKEADAGAGLVDRLRTTIYNSALCTEAADTIAALRRQVAELQILNDGHQRLATKYRERAETAEAERDALRKLLDSCSAAMQENTMKYKVTDWTHMIAAIGKARKK